MAKNPLDCCVEALSWALCLKFNNCCIFYIHSISLTVSYLCDILDQIIQEAVFILDNFDINVPPPDTKQTKNNIYCKCE